MGYFGQIPFASSGRRSQPAPRPIRGGERRWQQQGLQSWEGIMASGCTFSPRMGFLLLPSFFLSKTARCFLPTCTGLVHPLPGLLQPYDIGYIFKLLGRHSNPMLQRFRVSWSGTYGLYFLCELLKWFHYVAQVENWRYSLWPHFKGIGDQLGLMTTSFSVIFLKTCGIGRHQDLFVETRGCLWPLGWMVLVSQRHR